MVVRQEGGGGGISFIYRVRFSAAWKTLLFSRFGSEICIWYRCYPVLIWFSCVVKSVAFDYKQLLRKDYETKPPSLQKIACSNLLTIWLFLHCIINPKLFSFLLLLFSALKRFERHWPVIHYSITERFILLIQAALDFILILTPRLTVRTVNLSKI